MYSLKGCPGRPCVLYGLIKPIQEALVRVIKVCFKLVQASGWKPLAAKFASCAAMLLVNSETFLNPRCEIRMIDEFLNCGRYDGLCEYFFCGARKVFYFRRFKTDRSD